MPFELPAVTKVSVTKTNPRTELHGNERVQAIDIACTLTGENTLPAEGIAYDKGQKWRGYRLIRDYGLQEASFDYSDVVLSNLRFDPVEGGSVKLYFTLQYNGEELQDEATLGMLTGLARVGEAHFRLLAPPELVPVKKGYRAGKPDTPADKVDDGQRSLEEGGEEGGGPDGSDELDAASPEGAFAAAAAGQVH